MQRAEANRGRLNELVGGYTTASLLELAGQVPGLRSRTFDSAVAKMTYQRLRHRFGEGVRGSRGRRPTRPWHPHGRDNGKQITGDLYGLLFQKESFDCS